MTIANANNPLSPEALKALKAKAHHLDPVIIIGQKGLSEAVLSEIDLALSHHELIKIKAKQYDKTDCEAFAAVIIDHLNAHFVQRIGKTLIFYRKKPENKK